MEEAREETEADETMEEEDQEDEDTGAKLMAPTFYSDAAKYWKV